MSEEGFDSAAQELLRLLFAGPRLVRNGEKCGLEFSAAGSQSPISSPRVYAVGSLTKQAGSRAICSYVLKLTRVVFGCSHPLPPGRIEPSEGGSVTKGDSAIKRIAQIFVDRKFCNNWRIYARIDACRF